MGQIKNKHDADSIRKTFSSSCYTKVSKFRSGVELLPPFTLTDAPAHSFSKRWCLAPKQIITHEDYRPTGRSTTGPSISSVPKVPFASLEQLFPDDSTLRAVHARTLRCRWHDDLEGSQTIGAVVPLRRHRSLASSLVIGCLSGVQYSRPCFRCQFHHRYRCIQVVCL